MRAVRVHEPGGPEALTLEETDRPEPGSGEILVQVAAAGVNPVDTYFREGSYEPVERPFIPGVDFAGEVVAIGEGVTAFEGGERVFGTGIGNATYHGSYAEYARVPVDRVVELPSGVDPVAAAGVGVVGSTAWRSLIDIADLSLGETCLIHGGSGGVGHIAVQLAAAAGAEVIATSSPSYIDRVEAFGADTVLPYDHEELQGAIEETETDGIDVILDHKLAEYASLDAAVGATGARIVGIGEDHPEVTIDDVTDARSRDIQFTFMSMFNAPDLREPLGGIASQLAAGELEVAIARTFTPEEAPDAHEALFGESFLGKLVIEFE